MKTSPFQLRDGELVCLCAPGEVPAEIEYPPGSGKRVTVVQVFDRAGLEAMAASIQNAGRDVLVDFDHESCDDDKRTTAAGWVKPNTLLLRNDGLWAPVRWSDSGRAAVEGGEFRFTSPTVPFPTGFKALGGDRYRATGLDSVALTNRPRHRGIPAISILNRAPAAPAQPQPTSKKSMKKVTDLLGLAADASEDAIAAAVQLIQNNEKSAKDELVKNRKAEAAQICADRGVTDEGVVNAFTTVFVTNRDAALKLLPAGKEKKGPQTTVHNRETAAAAPNGKATTPGSGEEEPTKPSEAEAAAALVRNRAAEIQRTQRVSFSEAWRLAEAEQPKA